MPERWSWPLQVLAPSSPHMPIGTLSNTRAAPCKVEEGMGRKCVRKWQVDDQMKTGPFKTTAHKASRICSLSLQAWLLFIKNNVKSRTRQHLPFTCVSVTFCLQLSLFGVPLETDIAYDRVHQESSSAKEVISCSREWFNLQCGFLSSRFLRNWPRKHKYGISKDAD